LLKYSLMFLECRTTRINTPKSNELSLVFPYNQFCCRLDRKRYDAKHIDEVKFNKSEIDQFLDEIEKACGYYKKMQRATIGAIISLTFFIVAIVVGNVLLNIGLAKGKSTGEVEFTKFHKDGLVLGGALTLIVGVAQMIVSTIMVARSVRRERTSYETITLEMINRKNADVKQRGLRWKVGQCYNWIELSLDYKMQKYLVKQSSFTTLISDKTSTMRGHNESIPLTIDPHLAKGHNESIPLAIH